MLENRLQALRADVQILASRDWNGSLCQTIKENYSALKAFVDFKSPPYVYLRENSKFHIMGLTLPPRVLLV